MDAEQMLCVTPATCGERRERLRPPTLAARFLNDIRFNGAGNRIRGK
jgi:hypothetical protein